MLRSKDVLRNFHVAQEDQEMVVPLPPKADGWDRRRRRTAQGSLLPWHMAVLGAFFWSARKRPDIFTGRAATWVATRFRLLRCTLCRCLTFGTPVASPWLHPAAAKLLRSLPERFVVSPDMSQYAKSCARTRRRASRAPLGTRLHVADTARRWLQRKRKPSDFHAVI